MFLEKASLISIELGFWINFYLLKTLGQDKPGIYMVFATIRKFTAWDWSLVTELKKTECCNANRWCDCLDLTHKGFSLKSLCLAQACETQLRQSLQWTPLCKGSAPLWYLIRPYLYLNLFLHQQSADAYSAGLCNWVRRCMGVQRSHRYCHLLDDEI